MNYAEKERAALSRGQLSKRFGPRLSQWGAERRKAWSIDDSWSVDRFRRLIEQFQSNYKWQVLTEPAEIVAIDKWMQRHLNCIESRFGFLDRRHMDDDDRPLRLSIDEIEAKFRAEQPGITRQRLRSLLHRSTRKGILVRVAHGQYEEADEHHWSKHPTPPWLDREDDGYEQWRLRSAQREEVRRLVLVAHYVLPLPAARKARQFGLSERKYYYALCEAMAWFLPVREMEALEDKCAVIQR
jgi:hypothetical protein